ncbi:HD domain-containing protein [Petrimonas sp.]|uniref:HD domain-containing protein n=1 Tax=Petrimonas sp. TaxID=2023866 RepID=UPI003F516B9E
MDERIQQQLNFILEADKLKNVIRRNFLIDDSRRENVAEHSWHSILLAQLFFEYAENKDELDLLHIVKMITIHDIVEIYAGDTFMFDEEGYLDKFERENDAAKKIFGLLPPDQGKEMYDLWLEFEQEDTPNAIYACAIDKIMPVMLNTFSNGTSWREASITPENIFKTLKIIEKGPKKVRELLNELVQISKSKGHLMQQ